MRTKDLEEVWHRKDAWQRDYDSSVSGFGRRREIDDEANLWYIYDTNSGRLKQRSISNHQEREAHKLGYRDSREAALRLHGIVKSKFHHGKWIQNQGGKWVEVHPFGKPEGVKDDGRKQQFKATGHGGMPPTDDNGNPLEGVEEGMGADMAKLLGIPAVAGAMAIGAQHYDDQQPHVNIGGQNAKIVQYGSSQIPNNAMLLKGADGKMYRVWQTRGTGSGHRILASPAEEVKESATVGATSAANIGTVVSPQLSPGKARGKKSYTGSIATGSGTKAPPQPKVVQPKNSDGTAKNGLDMKSNIMGGPANEAITIKRR